MASHALRHRAICENDTFKGPWRTNIEDAFEDANTHRQRHQDTPHIINIITQQTISMLLE